MYRLNSVLKGATYNYTENWLHIKFSVSVARVFKIVGK